MAALIPIDLKPEPLCFDKEVRQKGRNYLAHKGIALDKPLPEGVKIKAYWRASIHAIQQAYI